jgi:putative endonuclease
MKTHEHYYVYILQSMKDFSFYAGHCEGLDNHMSKHFDGFSKYTASKGPWRLVYFEKYNSRSDAIKREKAIKNRKSRKYVMELIESWQTFLRTSD